MVFANNTVDHGDTDKFESPDADTFNSPVCSYFLQPLKHSKEKKNPQKRHYHSRAC